MDHYIVGALVAVLLGLLTFYGLFSRRNSCRSDAVEEGDSCGAAATTSVVGGECRSRNSGVDVIIVGAGVAGAALAHTLGKVLLLFFCCCLDFGRVVVNVSNLCISIYSLLIYKYSGESEFILDKGNMAASSLLTAYFFLNIYVI